MLDNYLGLPTRDRVNWLMPQVSHSHAERSADRRKNVGESVSGGACPRWGYYKPSAFKC